MSKKFNEEKLFTETELELISILWKIGEGSVADVIEKLPKERELAYTSVSTILRILEQKRVLKTRKEGRGHVYIPLVSKADYEERAVKHVVNHVFDGTPLSLARQLLNTSNLSKDDFVELKKLIKKAEKSE